MKSKLFRKLAIASALAGMSTFASAGLLVVDLFNTDQALISDSTKSGTSYDNTGTWGGEAGSPGDTSILGEYRDLYVQKLNSSTSTSGTVTASVLDGYLNFAAGPNVDGLGLVRWDGKGSTNTYVPLMGLGGLNLTSFTNFELMTIFSDFGFTFFLEVYTSETQWSRVSLISNAHDAADPGDPSYIPVSAFSPLACGFNDGTIKVECGGGGANLTNVNAMQAVINPFGGQTALDLQLNQVTLVPEPASIALLGLGLLGVGLSRRKAKAV